MAINEDMRARVQALLDERGWDMKQGSLEAGLNSAYIQQLMTRGANGGGRGLSALAHALGTTVDFLINGASALAVVDPQAEIDSLRRDRDSWRAR